MLSFEGYEGVATCKVKEKSDLGRGHATIREGQVQRSGGEEVGKQAPSYPRHPLKATQNH